MSEFVQIEIQLSRSSPVLCAPRAPSLRCSGSRESPSYGCWSSAACHFMRQWRHVALQCSHSDPIASWSCCPREWFFCSFCLKFPFPNGTPLALPALYCSLLLLSSASWQLAPWRCACALKQAASVSESPWLL